MTEKASDFEERLNSHPILRKRIYSLLEIIEDRSGNYNTADDAEDKIIEEVRHLGNELMHIWASEKESVRVLETKRDSENITGHGKKKLFWHTTFGEINICERVFIEKGRLIRPFSEFCEVGCREYSLPLQRRITDFGADVSFGKVPEKIREHYGITVPSASVRSITEKHAEGMKCKETLCAEIPETEGSEHIIAETDGSMIPIVDTVGKESDRRKNRRCRWKEARLTLSHPKGSVTSVFGCTLGSPNDAGDHMFGCAIRSGMGQKTKIHCIGDGAPWIREQADRVFGEHGTFLIDFYHLCSYLSEASDVCSRRNSSDFFNAQKQLAGEGRMTEVIRQMKPHTEPASAPDSIAPVRRCIRYIENRAGQFGYKEAEENGLPIGSGEIESAHRYIIQKRLKIPGAWWAEDNAQNMLSLRVVRANGDWETYWKNVKVKTT